MIEVVALSVSEDSAFAQEFTLFAGPLDFALPRTHDVTNIEVTLMAGETILNSFESQISAAEAIDYRRGLTHWLDDTIGYLREGNGITVRRHAL